MFLVISEDGQNTTVEMVVRFVSLIPIVNSNVLLIGRFDVWMTGDVSNKLIFNTFYFVPYIVGIYM